MPVHLMPGPLTGLGPPGKAAAPTAADPPGLMALFADLLLQSGSPAPKIIVTKPLSPQTASETGKIETEKNAANPLEQRRGVKNKQTTPLKVDAAAAKTQNAMDTSPVSLPSPGKSANRKLDGELPLSEAPAPVPGASSALPTFLPILSVPTLPVTVLPVQVLPVSAAPVSAAPVSAAPVVRVVTKTSAAISAEHAESLKPHDDCFCAGHGRYSFAEDIRYSGEASCRDD